MKLLPLVVALIAYAALVVGYATRTPIWQNPDEPAHFNYVASVATTGSLPELRPGDWDSALLERVKNGTLQPGDSISTIRYENWQPPLFYVVAAPVYLAGPSDPQQALLRFRLFDAVLGGLTLIVAYLVARTVLAPDLAAAVPLTIVGIPMFTAVSAGLSADALANLFAAAILWILVCLRRPVVMGATLGVGLLTKLALGIFIPLELLVLWRRPLQFAVALATTFVITLPWLIRQVTTYGWSDPFATARHNSVVLDQPRFAGVSFDYVSQFLTISFHSFWGQFGWMAIVAPDRLYLIWGVLSVLGLIGLALTWRRFIDPTWQLLLATVVVACVAYVGYNLSFVQFQGRYLFTALVPIAILLVAGWSALVPRRARLAVYVVPVALVALNAYALVRVLVPGFAPAT